MSEPIVIVGAGIGGLSAAKTLRQNGFDQRIVLLGGEKGLPYKRTHLSKNLYRPMIRGEFSMILMEELEELEIEYRSPVQVEHIEPQKNTLALRRFDYSRSDLPTSEPIESLGYSRLILALGSIPQVTPGYYFEDDFLNLQRVLQDSSRQVRIFGSGVLGAELAEQLSRSGHKVTLTCRGVYPMARELPNHIGSKLIELLADNGIDIAFGSTFPTPAPDSLVLSALGVQPQTLLAQKSGLEVGVGIKVNSFLETSVQDIYALGDCAEHPDKSISHLWHQAEEQGIYVGKRITGEAAPFVPNIYRTKAEFFGQRVFSSGIVRQSPEIDRVDTIESWSRDRIDFWARFRDERLIGLSFIGDWSKEFGKYALQGVREGWDRNRVRKSL